MSLVNGKRQISTPIAPTFIDRSSRNSSLRNTSGRPPRMKNFVKIGIRGWAGRTPSLSHRLVVSFFVFTARCTLVHLRSHGVCPSVGLSVRLSVTLVDCDHIGWNSSKLISPLVSLGCSHFATPTWRVCSEGNTPKFGPKFTHPLLIWASETFDRKLRPNGYR